MYGFAPYSGAPYGGAPVQANTTPVSTVTGVTVTPSTATIAGGATVDFDWVVNGTNSPNQAATVTTNLGTINSAGVVTAPAATSSEQTGTVTVTSAQDPTKSGTAKFTIAALQAGDTTAPILTAASAAATGPTTAAGSVNTNEIGTLYGIVTLSPTATASQVKSGVSQAVTSPGVQAVSFSGLPSGTVLYPHYLQADNANPPNESVVLNGSSFTTPTPADTGTAKATYVQEIFESRAGIPWANLNGMRWYFFDQVWPTPLRAPVAQGSLETTDGAAIDVFDIAGFTSLLPGQVGTLAYTNTNGDPDQSDLISIFCPVYVH